MLGKLEWTNPLWLAGSDEEEEEDGDEDEGEEGEDDGVVSDNIFA